MCGICGVVYEDPARRPDPAALRRMLAALRHRGPDGERIEILGPAGLGHSRLSVIDLEGGAQPMFNEDRSIAVVFNGEIYNFRDLRRRLAEGGHRLATDHSDTETLPHLYEDLGVSGALAELRGMFAFALWDAPRRRLALARDRAGKKPLYYAHAGGALWFASELKALLAIPEIPRRLDLQAMDDFLTLQYVPAPETIFRDIRKLPPAHFLIFENGEIRIERYWRLQPEPKRQISEAQAAEETAARIEEAVRLRLESDVPLGVFLSGGVDSSLVTAFASRHVSGPLRTFSIGFEQEEFNELPFARMVAERYATRHHEFIVRADAVAALPRLVWHYDEPYADISALPSFALAELARRHVTVALNGDGGDESFAGYQRYLGLPVFERWMRWPRPARRALAALLDSPRRPAALDPLRYVNRVSLASPALRYAQALTIFTQEAKARLCDPAFREQVDPGAAESRMIAEYEREDLREPLDRMLACDIETYLPGDLLPKVDRATMSCGLEGRSPLLDHPLMEFAASLPASVRFAGGSLKTLLRRVAGPLIPAAALNRPKQGFAAPAEVWFRAELRQFTRETLLGPEARGRGFFRPRAVEALLREHESGRQRHHHRIWALLCLELWFRTFLDRPNPDSGPLSL